MSTANLVRDYFEPSLYYFIDQPSRTLRADEGLPICGLGSKVSLGIWRTTRTTALLYAIDQKLFLNISGVSFDLSAGDIDVDVSRSIPFVRRILVRRFKRVVFSARYCLTTQHLREWPMPGDFFEYVASQTDSAEGVAAAAARWTLSADGIDLQSDAAQAYINERRQETAPHDRKP